MRKIPAALLLVLLTVFVSCEPETMLTVDQTSLSFTDTGGSRSITLTANKVWSASSNQSWCKVSPSGGEEASSSRITITCDANTTYDARNCTVTFTCAELTKTVEISQATNNGLLVSQTSYEITKAAQQLNIQVQANVKFSVDVDSGCKDWIKYNSTKGLTTSTVVLDIAENKTYDSREGKVTIKQDGGSLSSTIIIRQSQLDGLFITTPEYNLSNEKHTLTVEVSTNVEFDVKPEADWVKYVQTKGLITKQIVLEVAENDTYDHRETKVNVKQKNGDLSGEITIKQDEKYGILVTQSEYSLSNEAATIDVEVKYNVDFDVVIPDDCKAWIKQVSTKALNSKTYTFSIAKNETYDNREGSITLKQKKGAISTTVAIKQAQTDYLEVAKKEYTVDIEGETITIDVTSNVAYIVTISDDAKSWLSRVDTKGLSQDKVQIAVASGSDDTDRKGEIVIAYGEMKHTITVYQYSYASNTIIQFADEKVKAKLVEAFDTNKDGELSIKEARAVKSIEGVFGAIKTYTSFDEFEYFTGVDEVPNNMFADWRLISIKLPESIVTIGDHAFSNCKVLRNILMHDNVLTIKSFAFQNCEQLKTLSLSKKVTFISNGVFSGCVGLESIDIPDSVETISNYAFLGCTSIVSFNMPNSIKAMGVGVFEKCTRLTNILLSENLMYLPRGTFYGCTSLTSIKIPNSVTSIANASYDDNRNGRFGCFEGCSNLKSVSLSKGITTIGSRAFYECTSLQNINIPEGVSRIEDSAFYGCNSLSSVTLPESVSYLGSCAFENCTSINNISLPAGLSEIQYGTFLGCINLSSVIIPSSVTIIRSCAFKNCKLITIDLPESLTTIAEEAFGECTDLESISIPESVSTLGAYAFSYCTHLKSVKIPDSIAKIEDGTFFCCSELASIVIPDSVNELGDAVFEKCTNLESVSLPNGITGIGVAFFSGCSALKTIMLPESITAIGFRAFQGCSSLSSLSIPNNVTNIGNHTFVNCTNLTSIKLPDELVTIAINAFDHCSSLTSIDIPEKVQSIGQYAFKGCIKMEKIVVRPLSPPILERYPVFDQAINCPIYVPASRIDTYINADGWSEYAKRIKAIPE